MRPRTALTLATILSACGPGAAQDMAKPTIAESEPDDARRNERERMVRLQIEARGVADPRVLDALRRVPRHELVPAEYRTWAYDDRPLAIGHRQTISQPYIVALMTELLAPQPTDRVLEVGTGSGYQAAVLSLLVEHVHSIEIVEPLARRAAADLERLGFDNVTVIAGDGYGGLPEEAPFDGVIVTAAPPFVPQPLIDQLAPGGRLVIPVGDRFQELQVLERSESGITTRRILPVRFVPMTGEVRRRRPGD